jgi:hypothetical protein
MPRAHHATINSSVQTSIRTRDCPCVLTAVFALIAAFYPAASDEITFAPRVELTGEEDSIESSRDSAEKFLTPAS